MSVALHCRLVVHTLTFRFCDMPQQTHVREYLHCRLVVHTLTFDFCEMPLQAHVRECNQSMRVALYILLLVIVYQHPISCDVKHHRQAVHFGSRAAHQNSVAFQFQKRYHDYCLHWRQVSRSPDALVRRRHLIETWGEGGGAVASVLVQSRGKIHSQLQHGGDIKDTEYSHIPVYPSWGYRLQTTR